MDQFSVVIQGNLRPESAAAIRSARECFPTGELILSTWKKQARIPEYDLCDVVLELEDPGPLPAGNVYTRNLRRQTVSTRAGIERAGRDWVLKTRSDLILLDGRTLREIPERLGDRIGVWRNFTADAALNSALFHVSDLLQIGRRSKMLEYWPVAVPEEVGEIGLLPEQWLFLHFLYLHEEIDRIDDHWLRTGFRQIRTHQRALADYVKIIPAGVALLPERLRSDGKGFQDEDRDGSVWGSLSTYRQIKYREIRIALGQLKRRLLASR